MDRVPLRCHTGLTKGVDHVPSLQTTFHYFQTLPLEIRMMIWREALEAPNANQLFDNDAPKHSSVPLILSVCKESHAIAKRYYDFCFQRQPKLKSYPKLEDLKINNIQSLVIPKTESSSKLAHLIFRDSEDNARFLPRKELIIVARPGICKPTVFETRLGAILGGIRDPRLENFMAQLKGMKREIEKEMRMKSRLANVPTVRLMDQVTLNRWVVESQLRRDGLPWESSGITQCYSERDG
ncbi:hypothetical protein NA56DRAFT_696957 [Hyaloscypha hepaticicola]|uniref:2EXR domain-containing protein n=1 Tax=Hyaloscypha hepaticicola TaxID=2082293 RepID=A0A2J6QNU2_9HELO|nr:hypothetical protein NA56DRAFT_696957 [Hyaloscypha hepaticicola]